LKEEQDGHTEKNLKVMGGGGFPVKQWLTCRIGGGAWWWVCRRIVDLLKVFIV